MAAPALDVNWEAIKAHAILHGPRDAARSFQISEGTVMARCAREGWLKQAGQVQVIQPLPSSMQPKASNACKPSEAALNSKAKLGEKTWTVQSRAVLKGSRAAAKLPGQAILDRASSLKSLVDSADKLHGWSKTDQVPSLVQIHIAPAVPVEKPAGVVLDLDNL